MMDRQVELPRFSEEDLDRLRNGLPPQPDHWPTVEELREDGMAQEPIKDVLAAMRRRIPLMSHLTSEIRVN